MKSRELNEALRAVCDSEAAGFESLGGKAVAYIGWFWREVDFDADSCDCMGILPVIDNPFESNPTPKVGFMPNNKWGYESFTIKGRKWRDIKAALAAAAKSPTYDSLKRADDLIQATMPRKAAGSHGR